LVDVGIQRHLTDRVVLEVRKKRSDSEGQYKHQANYREKAATAGSVLIFPFPVE
jgi:hypothetical protein